MEINKVSVAMATYNGEKYIKKQLQSILNNLREFDEVVISDDGSNDNTLEIIKKFNDKRIKLIKGPQKGLNKNFENAIAHTTGDIIYITDQDDEWLPNKISITIQNFNNNPNIILLQHDAFIVDANDKILYQSFAEHRKVKTGVIKNIIKNSYHGCCMCFRKTLKNSIIPFPDDIFLYDQWIGIIAELNGQTKFISDKLIKYSAI